MTKNYRQAALLEKYPFSISGNTFPIKDFIKSQGGYWDAESKKWLLKTKEAYDACMEKLEGSKKVAPSYSAAPKAEARKSWVDSHRYSSKGTQDERPDDWYELD